MRRKLVEICKLRHVSLGYPTTLDGGCRSGFGMVFVLKCRPV